jgi:ABC-type uncharacterized transport system permease subunit
VAESANNRRETVESNPLGAMMISFCASGAIAGAGGVCGVNLAERRREADVGRESSARF